MSSQTLLTRKVTFQIGWGDTANQIYSNVHSEDYIVVRFLRHGTWVVALVMGQRSQGLQQFPCARFPTHRAQKLLIPQGYIRVTPGRRTLKGCLPLVPVVGEGEGTGTGQTNT